MRIHALLSFTSVQHARDDICTSHIFPIDGIVLDARDTDAGRLADRVAEIAGPWSSPVSILSRHPVHIRGQDGWSFVAEATGGPGVPTATDASGASPWGDLESETALVLHPDDVSFNALAGLADHLIVDARTGPALTRAQWRAIAEIGHRARRAGRSRADARRWATLRRQVTIADSAPGYADPALSIPEGWRIRTSDLVEPRDTTPAVIDSHRAQPRAGTCTTTRRSLGDGGVVYFHEHRAGPEDLDQALGALGAPTRSSYAAFLRHADDVVEQRFVTEVRLFAGAALRDVLGWDRDDPRVEQTCSAADLLTTFTSIAAEENRVHGAYGEDGDDAYARAGFGLWLENACHGVLRCWSRPVLVLK